MISRIYTTFPDNESVQKILEQLLQEKLIACANILGPIDSLYIWKEEVTEDSEIGCFLKTSRELSQQLLSRLEELHPYECPCITIENLDANPSYVQWVNSCLSCD